MACFWVLELEKQKSEKMLSLQQINVNLRKGCGRWSGKESRLCSGIFVTLKLGGPGWTSSGRLLRKILWSIILLWMGYWDPVHIQLGTFSPFWDTSLGLLAHIEKEWVCEPRRGISCCDGSSKENLFYTVKSKWIRADKYIKFDRKHKLIKFINLLYFVITGNLKGR